jgi:hypothetical protein
MKKFFLLFINFFIIVIIHAQKTPQLPPSINNPDSLTEGRIFPLQKFSWRDSLSGELRKKYFSNEMPPAGSMRKGFRYLGNNQKGFEIYQTLHDNMYILKPDSTFVSNMPVLKLTIEKKPDLDEKRN